MDIVSNDKVITQQRLLYEVDMIKNGEKWVVNNIIEYTNHLGNTEWFKKQKLWRKNKALSLDI